MRLSAFFLSAVVLLAQPRSFDIATFAPPAGWTVEDTRDAVSFTHIDQARSNFVKIGVYNRRPSSGDLNQDFAAEWKDLLVSV